MDVLSLSHQPFSPPRTIVKKLLLRCDDFGSIPGVNQAVFQLAALGYPLNVSVMVCGAFARSDLQRLVKDFPSICLGLHATVTSEWEGVKWGPARKGPTGLADDRGHFHPHPRFLSEVSPQVILEEIRAQILDAMTWGVRFSYLDEHMGFSWVHGLQPSLAGLAKEFGLRYFPRLPLISSLPLAPEQLPRWQSEWRVMGPEPHLLITHPAQDDDSSLLLHNESSPPGKIAAQRQAEFEALKSATWSKSLAEEDVRLITYRDLPGVA